MLEVATLIDTGRSALKTYKFEDEALLKSCVAEAHDRLDVHADRLVGFFSDQTRRPYTHGTMRMATTQRSQPALRRLLHVVNAYFSADYNAIAVNYYCDGTKYIVRHCDDMSRVPPVIGVVIISYGSTRNFRVFNKDGTKVLDIPVTHGLMLQMSGDFQLEFDHDIEPTQEPVGDRYSFTFRRCQK